MNKHDHDDCEHELAYCEQHDVAYCSRCDEEWGKWEPCTLQHSVPFYPGYTDTSTVTAGITAVTVVHPGTSIAHTAC